jgi:hypothetical protein
MQPINPLFVNGNPNFFVFLLIYGDIDFFKITFLEFDFFKEQSIPKILVKS